MNDIPVLRNAGERFLKRFFRIPWFFFKTSLLIILGCGGCTLFTTRPVQEMSFTAAAIRAAREVQADTLAPELFRQSNEWFFQAKHEYKFKNFKLAKKYADKSRYLAEQAEFEALKNGGIRSEQSMSAPDPLAKEPMQAVGSSASGPSEAEREKPYEYPTPAGTPADEYEKRRAEEQKAVASPPPSSPKPVPVMVIPTPEPVLPQPTKSVY